MPDQNTPTTLTLVTDLSSFSNDWSFSTLPSGQDCLEILDYFQESPTSSPINNFRQQHPWTSSHPEHQDTSEDMQYYNNGCNSSDSRTSSTTEASYEQYDDFSATISPMHSNRYIECQNPAVNNSVLVDRTRRRREQNRKAQNNFRLKRKAEVQALEQELEELREQLSAFHRRGPTVEMTICTHCREFYPRAAS
jgi:hypothetical protein